MGHRSKVDPSTGRVLERRRLMGFESKGMLSVAVQGRLWHGEVKALRTGAAASVADDSDLNSQFPGKIRKILVTEGQTVAAGETLLLMEAMKMEFAIKAPYTGRVKKLKVSEGQQVSPGDRFLDLELEKGEKKIVSASSQSKQADGVTIFEVGPRDGLQTKSLPISLAQKLSLISGLVSAGLKRDRGRRFCTIRSSSANGGFRVIDESIEDSSGRCSILVAGAQSQGFRSRSNGGQPVEERRYFYCCEREFCAKKYSDVD